MAQSSFSKAAAHAAAADPSYQDEGLGDLDIAQAQERYGEERAKRLRTDGNSQYIDISLSDKFRHFIDDPWVKKEQPVKDARDLLPEGRTKVLILGAGFGGLLHAVRLIQAGISASDIRLVDVAGGFGGTWYFNRYPGLMCDVESYCYMPLLEETGYIPKHKYAYGPEIREHANRIAEHWDLTDKALFQTLIKSLVWDEATKDWQIELVQERTGYEPQTIQTRSQFVVLTSGVLLWPKLPGIPGIENYKGHAFHTSRWDYDFTGGSTTDTSLPGLRDKNVAIIGAGAQKKQPPEEKSLF